MYVVICNNICKNINNVCKFIYNEIFTYIMI